MQAILLCKQITHIRATLADGVGAGGSAAPQRINSLTASMQQRRRRRPAESLEDLRKRHTEVLTAHCIVSPLSQHESVRGLKHAALIHDSRPL